MTWQNQQSDRAPSEDSDQPGHAPSLIRVFAVRMKKAWALSYPLNASEDSGQTGGCPDWSESSLGAQSLCWFCHVAVHFSLELLGYTPTTSALETTTRMHQQRLLSLFRCSSYVSYASFIWYNKLNHTNFWHFARVWICAWKSVRKQQRDTVSPYWTA